MLLNLNVLIGMLSCLAVKIIRLTTSLFVVPTTFTIPIYASLCFSRACMVNGCALLALVVEGLALNFLQNVLNL